jgi:hypothetical protein
MARYYLELKKEELAEENETELEVKKIKKIKQL